ncbi:hypothetical protein Unana1_07377 [Umbelopsis nana]
MASEKKDSHLTEHISKDIEITATVQEFDGLRRVAEKIPTGAWFIVVTEFCERFAYYGGSALFQNYVQFPPGDDKGQAGALGRGQATATAFYWAAYLLPTRMFDMAIVVFIAGNKFYIKPNPTKSILIKVFKVFRFSRKVAKRPENKAARSACKYPFDFAKQENGMKNSALLTQEGLCQIVWDDTFLEELKTTIMACKIFIPLSLYWVCYSQLSNDLLSQAAQLTRPNGLPNNIMNNFNPIALIIFIPVTDGILFPLLRKYKINILT